MYVICHQFCCLCCLVPKICPTLWDPMASRMPGSSVLQGLLTFTPTESMMLFNHLILCCPLLLLPSIFPSIRVFSNESTLLIRWPKYCSVSMSPSNKYSALIFFRIDQFDLLADQRTLKSLLQQQNQKASLLRCSVIFMVQLSHLYGKYLGKKHNLDYMDLSQQSDVSVFQYAVQVCHSFTSKKQESFNFMAAVAICRDFGAQENKICHCLNSFPLLYAIK